MVHNDIPDLLLVSSEAVFLGNPGDIGVRVYGEYLLLPAEVVRCCSVCVCDKTLNTAKLLD